MQLYDDTIKELAEQFLKLSIQKLSDDTPELANKLSEITKVTADLILMKASIEKGSVLGAINLSNNSSHRRKDYLNGSTLSRDQLIAQREFVAMQPLNIDWSIAGLKDGLLQGASVERIGALTKVAQLEETEKLNTILIESTAEYV
jgi:hypothetical protein